MVLIDVDNGGLSSIVSLISSRTTPHVSKNSLSGELILIFFLLFSSFGSFDFLLLFSEWVWSKTTAVSRSSPSYGCMLLTGLEDGTIDTAAKLLNRILVWTRFTASCFTGAHLLKFRLVNSIWPPAHGDRCIHSNSFGTRLSLGIEIIGGEICRVLLLSTKANTTGRARIRVPRRCALIDQRRAEAMISTSASGIAIELSSAFSSAQKVMRAFHF